MLQMKVASFPMPPNPKSSLDIRQTIVLIEDELSLADRIKQRSIRLDQERKSLEDRIKEVNSEKVEDVSSDIEALEEHIFNLTCELERWII